MRSCITTLVILVLVAAGQPAQASDPARTLLVVGDSLSAGYGVEPSEGWTSLLQSRLTAEGYGYRVVNASISGDTTTGGLRRLPRALEVHQPTLVFIELGGNDGLRGTPVTVVRENLSAMIRLAREAGARVVLAGLQIPPNYGSRYTTEFARIYPELAEEYGVGLVDFFLDGVALNRRLMQPDGIHPNADGQARLLDNAWPVLKRELPEDGAGS